MNATLDRLASCVNRQRLIETAVRLIEVPSPTGEAGAVCDRLAEILIADGFRVERPDGGYKKCRAVAVRFDGRRPGKTLQLNGHLDTVHLPFVPPCVMDGRITGSGASDMKGGTAAAVEALRALRDADSLDGGSILLTAHDLHEAPWGDGRQLNGLIASGFVGDAVLLPEPLSDWLPVVGRGSATWKVWIRRGGPPVHEVMRPDEPSVIAAGAELTIRLSRLADLWKSEDHPECGPPSVFVGQIHGGEIYNQFPQVCWLEGTRRWLPGTDPKLVEHEFRTILAKLAEVSATMVDCEWLLIRDAFALDPSDPFLATFQGACHEVSGAPLTLGPKPFVDDGNSFYALAGVPAITHGPRAGGQHTVDEWVDIDDLTRVARLYALTAVRYCSGG